MMWPIFWPDDTDLSSQGQTIERLDVAALARPSWIV